MTEPNHMIPLSAMRAIAVEAIRAVTGCPDVEGNGRYLVDELEDVALAAWRAFQAEPAAQQALDLRQLAEQAGIKLDRQDVRDALWLGYEAARAAAPKAGDEWQPIETAPKDRTEILGLDRATGALVLYWDEYRWSDGMSRFHRDPSHWMPIPPAPAIPSPAAAQSNCRHAKDQTP